MEDILMRKINKLLVKNKGMKGIIIGVIMVGIMIELGKVMRMLKEIRWVNQLREGESEGKERKKVMMEKMREMIGRRKQMEI